MENFNLKNLSFQLENLKKDSCYQQYFDSGNLTEIFNKIQTDINDLDVHKDIIVKTPLILLKFEEIKEIYVKITSKLQDLIVKKFIVYHRKFIEKQNMINDCKFTQKQNEEKDYIFALKLQKQLSQ